MARILLIDDDRNLLDVLAMTLEDEGHEVHTASDGASGYRKVEHAEPQLVVSDVNMPVMDGFSLCRKLRSEGNQVPIVLLTARDSEIDEALGLELGADDYVVKPFRSRVLVARVNALLRRQTARGESTETASNLLERDGLRLDQDRLLATLQGSAFETTVTEFRLLTVLLERPGIVFSRAQLLDRIRGDDSVVAERLIDTYVRRLRRKMEAIDASFQGIETVIGAGYKWRERGG